MPGLSGLSRAHSCPDLSALLNGPARPASALARRLSEARSSDAAPPRRHSLADLASYKADYSRDSVAALFAASSQSQRLGELYQDSPNRYAKLEIAEFAKVYSQLSRQEGLSEQARQALDGLAQQYTDKILKDGLGEKSAFGPWTPRTDKQYQQRSKLEHKLAVMMERQCPGGVLQLGNDFMRREVVPFILSRVESHLGRQLDESTCQRLTELVDSAAMKAFEELRLRRGELIEQRGVSVGTLARDLDTVAILPQLLRSLLEGLGQGPKDPQQPEPVRADQPDPGPGPRPSPGPADPGETPRPQEVHYHFNFNDNSQDNRQDNRRWNKRGDTYLGDVHKGNRHHGGAPSRLVTSLRMPAPQIARSQDLPTPQQATVSETRHPLLDAASQVTGALSELMNTALGEDTLTAPIPGAAQAGKLDATARQARLDAMAQPQTATLGGAPSGVEQGTQTDAGQALRHAASQVTGALSELMNTALGEDTLATPIPGAAQAGKLDATARQARLDAMAQPQTAILGGAPSGVEQGTQTDAGQALRHAASQVTGALSELMNTALGEDTLAAPIPGAAQAGKLDATARQARLDATAQPQTASLGGEFSGLSFRGGPLRNLPSQAYLRSQIFHSTLDGHAAGRELIKALRDALEPDAAQPFAQRREFEALRNRMLPSGRMQQDDLLRQFADGAPEALAADARRLGGVLAEHPGLERQRQALGGFAQTLIRETNLVPPGGRVNPLLGEFLNGLGLQARNAPAADVGARLHQAAREVADGLSHVLDTAAGRRVEGELRAERIDIQQAASTPLDQAVRLSAGDAPAAGAGSSLHQAARQVADGLSQVLNAAAGQSAAGEPEANGQASQPGRAPTADAAAPTAERDGGGFDGLKFRDGNLYTLPTQAYLRSRAFALDAGSELIRAVRGALEPDATQPFAQRREFEALRNRVLPGNSTQQSGVLKDFADGKAGALGDDAAQLRQVLAEHPGLERQRQALGSFARTLIREANLLPRGKPANPLVVELLSGLGLDAAAESRRGEALSSPSGVTLTTDGLHLDPNRIRERNRGSQS
ncbi:hypothetical protein VI26_05640 [Chromobacterium sp. LK1]|uniref:hypothetical protein n=1 Tax=Chromobacterium sp. LK1 TaxID=1628193 RepID=UPI0006529EB3|nr:hypothetical protein [Chromobacterium sp. LK1]KMN36763.1 hypothetical protein VI26_05640 [Chromobacterium sp. LK1]